MAGPRDEDVERSDDALASVPCALKGLFVAIDQDLESAGRGLVAERFQFWVSERQKDWSVRGQRSSQAAGPEPQRDEVFDVVFRFAFSAHALRIDLLEFLLYPLERGRMLAENVADGLSLPSL